VRREPLTSSRSTCSFVLPCSCLLAFSPKLWDTHVPLSSDPFTSFYCTWWYPHLFALLFVLRIFHGSPPSTLRPWSDRPCVTMSTSTNSSNGRHSPLQNIDLAFDNNSLEESARSLVYRVQPKWRDTPGEIIITKFTDGITNTVSATSRPC
jgi:hypothetical protein